MELGGSAVTAALVGVIVVLTKVIEWLMKRYENNKSKSPKEFNGHGERLAKIETKIDGIATGLQEMREGWVQRTELLATIAGGQEHIVERLGDVVSGMDRIANSVSDLKGDLRRR